MALLMMLAVPVLAQTGNITVTLDCYNDPEGVTVNNATDASITVTGVTSSEEPDGDPERSLDVTVAAGDTVRIDIGAEEASSDNIFNNELNESATVYTSVGNVTPTCEEAAGIGVGLGDGDEVTTSDDDQDDGQEAEMPDTGAGGLAPGATIPVGTAAAGLTMLVGAGFAVLRQR